MTTSRRGSAPPAYNDSIAGDQSNNGAIEKHQILQRFPYSPAAKRVRQLIKWRIPAQGYVDMYINPQQFKIDERKIVKYQRTKGGYIVQYWGEELTKITMDGSTAASGIEGINILHDVYRAEQNAFQKVAKSMADRLNSFSVGSSVSNLVGASSQKQMGQAIGSAVSGLFGGSSTPPVLPTLGSLALSVELFYQGWVFKGFFENFSITESVADGPGVFKYSLTFVVTDRRGTRVNTMPWHRSPGTTNSRTGRYVNFYRSSDTATPMSFGEEK